MIQTLEGVQMLCPDVKTLEQWVLEGRVLRSYNISVDGKTWRRLGAIEGLRLHFDARARADLLHEMPTEDGLPVIDMPALSDLEQSATPPTGLGYASIEPGVFVEHTMHIVRPRRSMMRRMRSRLVRFARRVAGVRAPLAAGSLARLLAAALTP